MGRSTELTVNELARNGTTKLEYTAYGAGDPFELVYKLDFAPKQKMLTVTVEKGPNDKVGSKFQTKLNSIHNFEDFVECCDDYVWGGKSISLITDWTEPAI